MILNLSTVSFYSKLFIGLLLIQLLLGTIWHAMNNSPIAWDPAAHTYITLHISDAIKGGRFLDVLYTSNYYPIFVHTLVALIVLPLRMLPIDPVLLVQFVQYFGVIFFVLSLIPIFLWIKMFFSVRTAFFATTLFSLFPIVFSQSHFLMLDIPLLGLFFAALIFLEKSNFLHEKKNSLLFFLFFALIIMTKWIGVLFFTVPGIYYSILFFSKLRNKELKFRTDFWINILKGILIVAVIVLPWYIANFKILSFLGSTYIVGEAGADPDNLWSIKNIREYLNIFTFIQVTPIPALLFIATLLISFFTKFRLKALVLSMILVNYFIFTFISNKDARYTMIILPFMALLFVEVWFSKKIGKVILSGLILFLGLYMTLLTLRPAQIEGYRIPVDIPFFGLSHLVDFRDYLTEKYEFGDWMMYQLMDDLEGLPKKHTKIIINSEHRHLNASNVQAYLEAFKLTDFEVSTPDMSLLLSRYQTDRFPTNDALLEYIKESDYLLVPKGAVGSEFIRNKIALQQVQSFTQLDTLVPCKNYQQLVADPGMVCRVEEGEIFGSGSDIVVDDITTLTENVKVQGPAKVACPWGCSFFTIQEASHVKSISLEKIKEYTLANGEVIQLFKIQQ